MPCSVARALGSMSVILVAGASVRGYWQGGLGHGRVTGGMACSRVIFFLSLWELGAHGQYSDCSTGWMVMGSNAVRDK